MILLVEDDPRLGTTVRTALEEAGFQVNWVYDGQVAERVFSSQSWDLILLDINLPGINGWELCRRFRVADPQVPVLMLTALGDLQDKLDAFSAGADDYLVKPFHLHELLARIRVFLRRKQPESDLQPRLQAPGLEMDLNTKWLFLPEH